MRLTLRLATAMLVPALLVGAIACGDDDDAQPDTVPVDQWAADVCTALDTLAGAVQEDGAELQQVITTLDQTATPEQALEGPINDLNAAFTDASNDVENAGVPDVPDGEQVVATLEDALTAAEGQLDAAFTQVSQAAGGDPGSLEAAAQDLDAALQGARTILAGTPDGLPQSSSESADELTAAIEGAESCQSLRGRAG